MYNEPTGKILRNVRTVAPGDMIVRAAEAMRSSGIDAVPVISGRRVMGVVTESAVLEAMASDTAGVDTVVDSIIDRDIVPLNPYIPLQQVAELMSESGRGVVPVVNEYGEYLGIVTRTDVIGALSLTLRPPIVGGLATPLGVYLTTGQVRAGVGDFGLFLTGVVLGLMRYAADVLVYGCFWLVQRFTNFPIPVSLMELGTTQTHWMDYAYQVLILVTFVMFLVLLRISSLSGYHAAEHMTVNAIERGEPLKPEIVRTMPRVHLRCGTNLLAAIVVFMMVADKFSSEVALLVTIFVLVFAWRALGGYMQYFITTKPPSEKQLASGIKAGQELLAKYRANPVFVVKAWQRIWNTGMLQVMTGMALILLIGESVVKMILG